MVGAADEHPALGSQELHGLVEHDLDRAGVPVLLGGQFARARCGADVVECDNGTLGLRDGLVCDDHHLPVAQRLAVRREGDQPRQVVAGAHLRQAPDWTGANGRHRALRSGRGRDGQAGALLAPAEHLTRA